MSFPDSLESQALKRAAGYALREISTKPGRLLSTLQGLGYGSACSLHTVPAVPDAKQVRDILGEDLLRRVAEATGQLEDTLAETLGRQLGTVAVFAELDGGRLEDNVIAAENLIRSGRVDLFTR